MGLACHHDRGHLERQGLDEAGGWHGARGRGGEGGSALGRATPFAAAPHACIASAARYTDSTLSGPSWMDDAYSAPTISDRRLWECGAAVVVLVLVFRVVVLVEGGGCQVMG